MSDGSGCTSPVGVGRYAEAKYLPDSASGLLITTMSPPMIHSSYHWKTIQVVACVFHGSAIATTIFRLAYRWCTSRFWWEDTWVAIALVFDVVCLAGISWGHFDDPHVFTLLFWILPIAFTCVLWAARLSIVYSILRVANPRNALRRIVYGIVVCFAIMWVALVIQKVFHCEYSRCDMGPDVAITLLISDTASDLMLIIMPTYLLRDAGLTYRQRILVISAFYTSFLITALAIPLSVLILVDSISDIALIFAHVKPATSLMVANLLVVVSFVHRYFRASRVDLDQPAAEFTTIDLSYLTNDRSRSMANASPTATSAMTSTQKGLVCEVARISTQLSNNMPPSH